MNSSGWDRFQKQQATEREQLRRLLAGLQPLLARCRDAIPNEIELSALAAMLHSFCTGIENIFKRLTVEVDGERVQGDAWHRERLLRMKSPGAHRPALLSSELHDALLEYLRFRHVFRCEMRAPSLRSMAWTVEWESLQTGARTQLSKCFDEDGSERARSRS